MKAFETTASRMKTKGIPGLPPQQQAAAKPQTQPQPKKEKKEKPVAKPVEEQIPVANLSINDANKTADDKKEADPAKKLKALKKKLRDIEEIAKKNPAELTPEQAEKLGKKDSIENEIKELEAAIVVSNS